MSVVDAVEVVAAGMLVADDVAREVNADLDSGIPSSRTPLRKTHVGCLLTTSLCCGNGALGQPSS